MANRHSIDSLGSELSPTMHNASLDGRVEMSQDEIDAIIRNKRKVRDPKACYACHRRKVKCDRNLPCDSCIKRDHPELCSYERPTKKRRIVLSGSIGSGEVGAVDGQEVVSQNGSTVTVSKEQWDRLNQELQQFRDSVRENREDQDQVNDSGDGEAEEPTPPSRSEEGNGEGIHAPSNQMGTMHLGSQSVLAYMLGLGRSKSSQDAAQTLLVEDVLPKLGLDNATATYPFVDLWSSDSSIHNVSGLCGTLPDDALCREFFVAYRDIAYTIYPVLPEVAVFESTLNFMLANRTRAAREGLEIDPDKPYGVSLPWLSLAFSVFASGAQATTRPAKERELTSQVYICSSYHALRMSNFMIHPCLETIQASLIIANVLSHNMNPGVAYIFLGMTVRMAFSIGLQINSTHFSEHDLWTRRRVWWALAWQDSHFAVSYDRPTSTVMCIMDIPYTRQGAPGNRSYAESMFSIIQLTQEIIRDRMLKSKSIMSWNTIQRYVHEIASIKGAGAPHLRDKTMCIVTARHLERLALRIHSSYVTSELCRPALKDSQPTHTTDGSSPAGGASASVQSPTGKRRKSSHASGHSPASTTIDVNLIAHLRRECIRSLEDVITAYVELNFYSECAARSWIGVQRSMSAAFLLATIPEALQENRVRQCLRDLQALISKRYQDDPTYEFSSYMEAPASPSADRKSSVTRHPAVEPPHWARTMSKSLNALGKLNAALAEPWMTKPNQLRNNSTSLSGVTSMGNMPRPNPTLTSPTNVTSPTNFNNSVLVKQEFPSPSGFSQNAFLSNTNSPATAMGGYGSGTLGGMTMGSYTPDSSAAGSDWNQANMMERAMEFVPPALWG